MKKKSNVILIFVIALLPLKAFAESWTANEVLSATLVLEAGNQGREAMHGVMNVIENRGSLRADKYLGVVLRRRQFTVWNGVNDQRQQIDDIILRLRRSEKPQWDIAEELVCLSLLEERLFDITNRSTHFYSGEKEPWWAKAMMKTIKIGTLQFLRAKIKGEQTYE